MVCTVRKASNAKLSRPTLTPTGLSGEALGATALAAPRPLGQASGAAFGLRRTWTLAKGDAAAVSTRALPPFLFDVALDVSQTMDLVRASVHEEVELQATLQVPMHQAIVCRIEAYCTPFVAPPLKEGVQQEADLQFAACMASPPELEEAPSFGLQRLQALVEEEEQEGQQAGQQAGSTALSRAARTGGTMRSPFAAQHMQQQQAPSPVKSMDDEGPAAGHDAHAVGIMRTDTLHRRKEQALRLVVKTSQNALAALLGVAYMLMHLNGSSSGGGGGGSGAVPGLQLRRTTSMVTGGRATVLRRPSVARTSDATRRAPLAQPLQEAVTAACQAAQGSFIAQVLYEVGGSDDGRDDAGVRHGVVPQSSRSGGGGGGGGGGAGRMVAAALC